MFETNKAKRHKRFNLKTARFKALLCLERMENSTRHAIRSLGWKTLDKPIFWGYERYFVIRPDLVAADNKTTAYLYEVLRYVQREERSKTKNFEQRIPKTKQKKERPHELGRVSRKSYNKMPEHLKAYFRKVKSPQGKHFWDGFEWVGAYYYTPTKPWCFVSKNRKFYITEVREHDNILLQELAECKIEYGSPEYALLQHAKGHRVSRKSHWKRLRDRNRKNFERNRKKPYLGNKSVSKAVRNAALLDYLQGKFL
jgi:hypothetical protein